MEPAADAEAFQRQYDEPVPDQGQGEAEDEPARPPSEKSREPRLEHGVGQSPQPGPERERKALRDTKGGTGMRLQGRAGTRCAA